MLCTDKSLSAREYVKCLNVRCGCLLIHSEFFLFVPWNRKMMLGNDRAEFETCGIL